MRRVIGIASVAVLWGVSLQAAPGDAKECFDSPCANAMGLAFDGNHLFISDWKEGIVFEVEADSGKTIRSFQAPTPKPFDLTFADNLLYVCDDYAGKIYALNLETMRVDRTFNAPGKRVMGLAYSNDVLYILESKSRQIYKVVPEDGTILGYIPLPDENCAYMTHDGKHLWIANRVADEVYMVDPETGMVISVIDAPGPYAAGITWIDGKIWNVDYQLDKVFEITTRDKTKYSLADPRRTRIEYTWTITNYGPGTVEDLIVNLAVPENLPNQELLSEVRFAVQPKKLDRDEWGSLYALNEFGNLPAGEKLQVAYTVDAQVSAQRFLIFPEDVGSLDDIPKDIHRLYTADGVRFRINSPYIKKLVKEIVWDEQNPYWIARKLYNHLITNIEYEYIGGWDVPEVVLRRGTGSCSEYAFCMIALCRAAGIPARYQGSSVWRLDDASIDEPFHRWAQIYLPNYGWIPVDPSRGAVESPVVQAKCFGQLANEFLITTHSGGDSKYLRWSYNHYANYKLNGRCKVEEDNFGFWEPLDGDAPTLYQKKTVGYKKCQP